MGLLNELGFLLEDSCEPAEVLLGAQDAEDVKVSIRRRPSTFSGAQYRGTTQVSKDSAFHT